MSIVFHGHLYGFGVRTLLKLELGICSWELGKVPVPFNSLIFCFAVHGNRIFSREYLNFVIMEPVITIITQPTTSEKIETCDPAFVDMILKGDADFENGNFEVIRTEDLWN